LRRGLGQGMGQGSLPDSRLAVRVGKG
jgi:hypothetical protein